MKNVRPNLLSPELQAALVTLEKLLKAERQHPGFENLDRLTLQIVCDGRASLYFENYKGHTIDTERFARDGDTCDAEHGKWMRDLPLYQMDGDSK